jgi:hypothetical protein
MRITRFTVLVALVPVLAFSNPSGAKLCMKKNGSLALRDACGRKETEITSVNTPFKGEKGAPGDKGTPGTTPGAGTGLRIVDSKGQAVGTVVTADVGGSAVVMRQIGADSLTFTVNKGGFVAENPFLLAYGSEDCAGAPYVVQGLRPASPGEPAPGDALTGHLLVDSAKTTGYVAGTGEVASPPAALYARLRVDGATADEATGLCTGLFSGKIVSTPAACDFNPSRACIFCCESGLDPASAILRPANPVDLSSLGLAPPFAYRP